MAHRHDPEDWQWNRSSRDTEREGQYRAPRKQLRDDHLERTVLAAGLTTASLDCEDGIDEAAWEAAMDEQPEAGRA